MNDDLVFFAWEDAVLWPREQPGMRELVTAGYYDDSLPETTHRFWQSDEEMAVREVLPPGRNLARDIGAGRGSVSYAQAREGYAVTALEPDPILLAGLEE